MLDVANLPYASRFYSLGKNFFSEVAPSPIGPGI